MGVDWESTRFGDVRTDAVHGRSGVGLSELAFTLVWSLHPTRTQTFSVFGTSVWVSAQAEGEANPVFIGQAMPEAAWCEETHQNPIEGRLFYRLLLPSPQLLALEHLRQGRGLVFTLDIRGNSQCSQGIRRFNETLTLRVNVSDWTRVLREANAADVLLVGVHLPAADLDLKYRGAIDLVRKANQHLLQGDFSVAVAECRRALESLWKAANLGPRAVRARQQSSGGAERQKMGKKDRDLAYGEALRHLCHSAHHVGADAAPEEFGRLDAALIVGSTAALVSTLIVSPDLVEPGAPLASKTAAVAPASSASATKKKAEASSDPRAERLNKAMAHVKKGPAHRPSTEEKLSKVLKSLFKNKLEDARVTELLADLKEKGVIVLENKKLTYRLK